MVKLGPEHGLNTGQGNTAKSYVINKHSQHARLAGDSEKLRHLFWAENLVRDITLKPNKHNAQSYNSESMKESLL